MTDIPHAAIDAAYRAIGGQLAAPDGIHFRDGLVLVALEAAAPLIAAAERERIRKLADDYDAVYPVDRQDTYGQEYTAGVRFSEVLTDPEGDRCICGPDSTGENPDCRPDCPQHGADAPYDAQASDIGEDPF